MLAVMFKNMKIVIFLFVSLIILGCSDYNSSDSDNLEDKVKAKLIDESLKTYSNKALRTSGKIGVTSMVVSAAQKVEKERVERMLKRSTRDVEIILARKLAYQNFSKKYESLNQLGKYSDFKIQAKSKLKSLNDIDSGYLLILDVQVFEI